MRTRQLENRRRLYGLLACWGWLTLAGDGQVNAATVHLGSSKDTTIFQSGVDNSAGGQVQFYSGTNTVQSPRRALIEFDIASKIPAGSYIRSVDLTLHLSMVAGSGMGGGGATPTIGLYSVNKEWGEGSNSTGMGQGSAAAPGDATWNSAFHGSQPWSTVGGDYNGSPSASLTIMGTKVGVAYTWQSTSALVADVQQWLTAPSTNQGWMLKNTDESGIQTFRAFSSKEANESLRPDLLVNYAIAGDANFDGLVDGADYTSWADHFLQTGRTWQQGDFNGDGNVDGADYTIWADHFAPGFTLSAVPEPSPVVLFALGMICSLAGYARRLFAYGKRG